MRHLGATGLALVVLAACSSDKPTPPPPNAGTLILHAQFASGPGLPSSGGLQVNEDPLEGAKVRVRAVDGYPAFVVKTNNHGNATLVLAPGVYIAQLDVDCTTGDDSVKVRIPPHGETHATVSCFGVG
jgi:hypothetical protein